MNPILLKPNSDMGSQVIIRGKAIGNMKAKEYHLYKPQLLHTVIDTHQQLQEKYQTTIILPMLNLTHYCFFIYIFKTI